VSPQATGHRLAAVLCLICGVVPIGIAFGVIPARPESIRAPLFIVALAGLLFWFAAASLLFGSTRPRLNSLLGAILFALFATIGGWVSVSGSSIAFGGGIAVVANDANEWIARAIFGLGALVCAACSLYALRRAIRTVA
jgi:ABC-type transport system involved in multi-copper enzyme maturation permease subunit